MQGIIFDCYGVLVHGSLDYLRSLTTSGSRQAFDDLARASDRGYVSADEYAQQAGELLGKSASEIREIIQGQEVRNPEMIAYVRELRQRGYKTAMLSNVGRGAIERLFGEQELAELFDGVVLSNETGVTKPNTQAYELAAAKIGLAPGECIMIDDIAVNVQGAENAGMKGVQFEAFLECKNDVEALLGVKGA